jgi:hypothetical protein
MLRDVGTSKKRDSRKLPDERDALSPMKGPNPQIGAHFGNITFSAVTKIVSRLAARMEEDRIVRKYAEKMKEMLSAVKG